MTQEEKAKAYDEAIKKAKTLYENANGMILKKWVEQVFPELAESDDERIRKDIIKCLKWLQDEARWTDVYGSSFNSIFAWLEKQGEDEYIDPDTLIQQRLDALADIVADQKSTDKVEPKFKAGDWAVSNLDRKAGQISEVHFDEYNSYYVVDGKSVNLEEYDRLHHLWTIQDAKDGDVLVTDNGLAFIYNGYLEEQQWPFAYGGINIYGRFNICDGLLPFTHQKVVPATKEQCDALIKAMTNAGYECDTEKKELRKIEQSTTQFTTEQANVLDKHIDKFLEQKKSTWSEEDEQYFNFLEKLLNNLQVKSTENEIKKGTNSNSEYYFKVIQWLKFLKDRVQLKQEWSKDDERKKNKLIWIFEEIKKGANYFYGSDVKETIDWLKSLRHQTTWKPSEKQMQALNAINVTGCISYAGQGQELINLYNDLKKLKG